MESICEGWLIKSPPEKRAQGRWKLFRAKWRRRYFVLYAPPSVDIIPGTCAAILDYYGGKALRHKNGTIDLTHCEEVLSQLDASFYRNVFGLRTKHKGRDRTYYLVAESESVMNEWVNSLCFVLGMKENVQDSVSSSISGPLPQPPGMPLPSPSTSSLFSSVSSLPAPRSETLPFPLRGSGKRILSHSRVQSVPGINEAANTEMDEWQVGAPAGRFRPPLLSAARVIGTRAGHMTLRFVPSLPVISSEQGHSCLLSSSTSTRSSIFADSSLSQNSLSRSTEYDHPRQSYYHKIPSYAVNGSSFSGNTSNLCNDFYSMPSSSTPSTSEQDNVYKIPRSNDFWQSDIRYDVPASARQSYDVPTKCPGQHTVNGEHYDVLPPGIPVPCFPSSCQRGENGSNSELSDEIIESSHLLSVLQSLISELPSVDISENYLIPPRGIKSGDRTSAMELLLLSPPPAAPSQHPQTNSGGGNGDVPSSADNSSSMPDQSMKPVCLPRHPAYNQVPTANDPICFTHRSRSFKRSIERTDTEKSQPLLMKKISDISESSSLSDDDDEEPFDVFNSDCLNEQSASPKQSIYDVPGPAPNISKDSEIRKHLGPTAVPSSVKFCKAVQPRRRIQYKEIDWRKIKALSEIEREAEDKRTNHW